MPCRAWERFFSQLENGKVIQGRVLWKLSDRKWIIRLLGRNLIARSETELSEGESITVRIEAIGPPVIMSLYRGEVEEQNSDPIGGILKRVRIPDTAAWRRIVKGMLRKNRRHKIDAVV